MGKRRNFMEKIRISVKKYVSDILMKDAEDFKITKNNGEINRNEFLNRLIVNYHDEYTLTNKHQIDAIMKPISKYSEVDDIDKINMANEILKRTKDVLTVVSKDDDSIILSLKPTKESEPIIEYIIANHINNQSISSFFSQMFEDYVNKVQTQRERIICEDNYRLLIKSKDKKRKVFVVSKNYSTPFNGSLYTISNSKYELFNYCLFEVDHQIVTMRLANIKSVKILTEPASFDSDTLRLMAYQERYGVEYTIKEEDLEEVKVILTDEGKKLFERMYLYRPHLERIEDDVYVIKGSHLAIFNYFKRFGKEAKIISPIYLKEKMLRFHKRAFNSYIDDKE